MDQHGRVDPVRHGRAGRGRPHRLHDPAAEARLVHPEQAGAQPATGTLPGAQGAVLL